MKKYNCLFCDYHTNNKTIYDDKHLLTAKHLKNVKNNLNQCKYCDDYFLESKLEYHKENECINYYKMMLNSKNCEIKEKDFEIEKLKIINEKNEELNNYLIKTNDFLKTMINEAQDSIIFILKNASQFLIFDSSISKKEIINCVSEGCDKSVNDLILKLCPSDIKHEKQCLLTSDLGKNEYIIKTNKDDWDINMNTKPI